MKISKIMLATLVGLGIFAASTVAQAAPAPMPGATDSAKTLHKSATFGMKKKHRHHMRHHMMKHMMKY